MIKRLAVFGIIVALVAVGATLGCGDDNGGSGGGGGDTQPTPTPQEQVGELPGTYQYTMEFSDSNGTTVDMNVQIKGDKSRIDYTTTLPGVGAMTTVFIDDGQFFWIYTPASNTAMKYSMGGGDDPSAAYSEWFTGNYYGAVSEVTMLSALQLFCSSAYIGGNENIDGQPCTVFTCDIAGATTSYWITSSGWLAKLQVSQGGYTAAYQFTNVNLNPSIADSVFDINVAAPGATIMDLTGF